MTARVALAFLGLDWTSSMTRDLLDAIAQANRELIESFTKE